MPSKYRKRFPPPMVEFKQVVAVVAMEVPSGNVTDVFHAVRRRCPEWAVTPHRVRKALSALQNLKKKSGKQGGSGARSSTDSAIRTYPHDIVELRPHAGRMRHAQWQWRGQVLRVAGYDDGETTDDEDQELPPGHCSVFWLGHGLEQWPNALTKESSVKVLDRPWVLGDRVARSDDPRSLGTVVGVACCLVAGVPGPAPAPDSPRSAGGGGRLWEERASAQQKVQAPVKAVRAVGGFRADDWVADEATRWVGKVEEAVFRVEVELCGKSKQSHSRGKGRHKPPVCVFQVSSEGLQGLEPAGGEDATPQELSPHFPGQRVKAPSRLWRQAEWIRGSLGRRSPRRGASIRGVISSVECCLLAVRWLAGVFKDSRPPDEWVAPETLRVLCVSNSSEGWALGDHVQVTPDWHSPSAVIVASHTVVDVRWADGRVETGVSALKLCPRPHISAHDFLPHDFVARSSVGFSEPPPGAGAAEPAADPARMNVQNQEHLYGEAAMNADMNNDSVMYGYAALPQEAAEDMEQILVTDALPPPQAETPLGVVTSVNLQARTAMVQWPLPAGTETEEVSVFELTGHPLVDVRLGDAVIIPDAQDQRWAGRICGLREDGCAHIELLDGTSQWHDVRKLFVVDDGEDAESVDDDMGSEAAGSTPLDGLLSEISEEARASGDEEGSVWLEAQEELEPDTPRGGEQDDAAGAGVPGVGPTGAAEPSDSAEVGDSEAAAPAGCVDTPMGGDGSSTSQRGGASSSSAPEESSPEILPFDVCDDDVQPTDHCFLQNSTFGTRALMMAARREMVVLRKGLLEGSDGVPAPIIVRTFSSRSDLLRAMVVGPPETPYALVPFFFDLALPSEYPREPPMARFHAHFVGNERLNPNLYVDGKVCLSLLGTWSGPAWDPQRSTMLQVLVSLQGLVLVEEPYFNEPGHECDMGTEQGRRSSALYNEHARLLALRAALNVAQKPPRGFHEIVANFFARFGPKLVEQCEEALREPKASQSSEGFRKVLEKTVLPRLRERWGGGVGENSASSSSC